MAETQLSPVEQNAHDAMRELWGVAQDRLSQADHHVQEVPGGRIWSVETFGAKISEFLGEMTVTAAIDYRNGTSEIIRAEFPNRISNLHESLVTVISGSAASAEFRHPPLAEYPDIATRLGSFI